jgi:hypothetical protein
MSILLVFISMIVAVAAFSPASRIQKSAALRMGYENEIGAQPPLGFWDPLGLLNNVSQERFDRLRYVETKHGRIAMVRINQ